jgi:hypothetical protein
MLPRRRVDKSQPVALRHFFLLAHLSVLWGREGSQGVSGARRGLRHDRVGWGKKSFIPCEGLDWKMRPALTPFAGRGGR